MIATSLSMILAAALAGQPAERPPTVRYVSLPDSYAPELAPGEILVPGSVHEVVSVVDDGTPIADQDLPGKTMPTPGPPQRAAPQAPGAGVYTPPGFESSSCYSSQYAPSAGRVAAGYPAYGGDHGGSSNYRYGYRSRERVVALPPPPPGGVLVSGIPRALFGGRGRVRQAVRIRSVTNYRGGMVCGPGGCY